MTPINDSAEKIETVLLPEVRSSSGQYTFWEENIPAPKKARPSLLRLYALSDVAGLALGFGLSWGVSVAAGLVQWGRGVDAQMVDGLGLGAHGVLMLGVLLWFLHTGHYRMRMSFWMEGSRIAGALSFAMLVEGFLQFAAKQDASRLFLMSGWVISALMMMGLRSLLRHMLRQRGLFQVRTVLIGGGETAEHIRAALKSEPGFGYDIVAQVKNLPAAFLQAGASWKKLCAIHNAEHIIIALDGNDLATSERPLAQLVREPVQFSISPPLRHLPVYGMVPQYFFSHDSMLMTRSSSLDKPLHCLLKRVLDITLAGGALIALSPVMLVVALLVKRDGGPAFYGHMRLGKDGKAFPCMKFRSMVMGGDAVLKKHLAENPAAQKEWQATRKLQDDPRVTAVGRFTRRTSLDELPQLINVIRGQMSIVGPRPIVTAEVANYEGDIAHYYRVRPGITGLWQVSGRNDVSYQQRVHMDSWYVRNWSLWHDIAIICKTFPAILQKKGAY